ncbi:hypothetical protein SISSUDRAFT_1130571 [Sistotremastrum suecicum HHB10207 ss-3]|uniref:Uncharacterized protein n=1 Tax=Sistotremastrum suecicum HHB10207 ss-3 TaxID=1314776 RepID=A0A166B9Y3_9AGAM|nr:hypothetical protein SISSUDRAFT_1130571 [Sistotremastrum suecicum HHB10207 ss-3]
MTLWFSGESEVNLSSSADGTPQCPPQLDTASRTMDQRHPQPARPAPIPPSLMEHYPPYHSGEANPPALDSTTAYSFYNYNGPASAADYNGVAQHPQTSPPSVYDDISSPSAQLSLNIPPANPFGWDQSSNPNTFAGGQPQSVDTPISPNGYSTQSGAFSGNLSPHTAQSHTIAQFSELPAHTLHQYATNGHPGAGTPPSRPPASSVKQEVHGQETARYTTSIHPTLYHRQPKRSHTLESEADLPDAEAQPKSPTGSRDPRQLRAEVASRKKKKDALGDLGVVLTKCMGRHRVPETAADRMILAKETLEGYLDREKVYQEDIKHLQEANQQLEARIRQLEGKIQAEEDLRNMFTSFAHQ